MAKDTATPADPGLQHISGPVGAVLNDIAAKMAKRAMWERREPGHRPGERMLDGRPYVFNADSLNSYLAEEAVMTAPTDLTGLCKGELAVLDYRCIRRLADTCNTDPIALALHARVTAERRARGMDAAFGGAN